MTICTFVYGDCNEEMSTQLVEKLESKNITSIYTYNCYTTSKKIQTVQVFSLQNLYDLCVVSNYDWIWCLSCEAIPDSDCLEKLVQSTNNVKKASFIMSSVLTLDGHPNYVPPLSKYCINGSNAFAEKLKYGLLRVSSGAFISTLLNVRSLLNIDSHYVIDSSFNSKLCTWLIKNYGAGYILGSSVVYFSRHYSVETTIEKSDIKICAIVVTYNRKVLLRECMLALLSQNYENFDILIVDNASTDGTHSFIHDLIQNQRINYINTGKNYGGSGGFYYGMKYAYLHNYDWFWIMDDDVIPTKTALFELVNHLKYVTKVSFLASCVYSKEGTAINTPEISSYSTNGYKFWYNKLEHGMVRLAHATFVSLLINANAVKECGLPCKDYFIWGDDIEYTKRIVGKYGAAYLVGTSKVYHLRSLTASLNILQETNPQRIKLFYYLMRNTLLNESAYTGEKSVNYWIDKYQADFDKIKKSNDKYKELKLETIRRAIFDFKNKQYNCEFFKNRYNFYGQEDAIIDIMCSSKYVNNFKDMYGVTIQYKESSYSIMTLFQPISNFVIDNIPDDLSEVTTNEIKRNLIYQLNNKKLASTLVFDFESSCNEIYRGYCNNDLYLSCCSDVMSDYNLGKLKYLGDLEKVLDNDPIYDTLDYSIFEFAKLLQRAYGQKKIILIRASQNIKSSAKQKLCNTMEIKFIKLMPEINVIDGATTPPEKMMNMVLELISKNDNCKKKIYNIE